MMIQLDCRSSYFDALEAIGEEGLRHRMTSDVESLRIYPTDEDAELAIVSLLTDIGILDNDRTPGDDMDGDHGSALASAGFGTDEDYEHNSFDEGGE